MSALKELHDQMIAEMPASASHEAADCPICTPQISDTTGGTMSDTFTKDEVEARVAAAVAEAVTPLRTELDTFRTGEEAAAVEARIEEARAEAEEKVNALQAELDAKAIELEAKTQELAELVTLLEAEEARVTEEAAAAARIEERTAAVNEVGAFSEEYVQENAARWASMDDEAFEVALEDYKVLAEKAAATGGSKIPVKTAMTAARDDNGGSALNKLSGLIRSGFDPRSVR